MLTTLWAFLLALAILIVVHEWGHYRAARACGVKVLRFSVGFGPVIWRSQRGETEFALSLLPLGGYVRMLDEREGSVAPAERHRAFNRLPLPKRAFIVAAGPVANLVLAALLYAVVNWIGVQEVKPILAQPAVESPAARAGLHAGDWVQAASRDGEDWAEVRSLTDLNWQVMQAALDRVALRLSVSDAQGARTREVTLDLTGLDGEVGPQVLADLGFKGPLREPVLGRLTAGAPAQAAGLREGDRVLAVDGRAVATVDELFAAIQASGAGGTPQRLLMRVQRDGRILDIAVTPRIEQDQGRTVGRIGAALGGDPQWVEVRYGPWEGLVRGVQRTWDVSAMTVTMLGRMLIGEASVKNISGPLTMADFAGRSAELGWTVYIGYLALVSVSLGVLNLLPLPMLDGGHLMYYLFEGVTGRPVSDVWLDRLQRGGLAILLLLMSLALYNDLARLLGSP
ncbi:MAG: RIP metalloprotease RseP [Aquabacterium sp.]|nr:RIP metalloprotease RseP [Aquabacterium sp.]